MINQNRRKFCVLFTFLFYLVNSKLLIKTYLIDLIGPIWVQLVNVEEKYKENI